MRDWIGVIPQRGVHWLGGKCRQCGFANEVLCICCHYRRNMRTSIDQETTQFNSLIRSNAT
jgi:hypothetical protein